MRLIGLTADQMEEELVRTDPEARKALDWMIERLVAYRRAVYPYQGMALYILAKQYDNSRANILEIGTAYGHSCFMIAAGAPQAHIVTLNPKEWEADTARKHLSVHHNVRVKETLSWEYLERYAGPKLDMIFVDGDHKNIRYDLPWWNRLKVGGLFIHHDYSPAGSIRECPPVFEALNDFGAFLKRPPDVLLVDDQEAGLAGWYRKATDPDWKGERWRPTAQPQSLELR